MTNNQVEISELSVAILAGGLGTRLRSVLKDRQKVMAQVADKPFIEHLLEQVNSWGVKHAVLCTGYLSEQVKEYFGDKYENVSLSYSEEQTSLGTAGALRFALPLIKSDPFIVMNGDSYCDVPFQSFWNFHHEKGAQATMALVLIEETMRYGRVDFDETFRIRKFEEKGAVSGAGWINAGIYICSKSLFESISKGRMISLEKEIFPELVGKDFYGYMVNSTKFIDIGTPESMQRASGVMFCDRAN